MAKTQGHLGPHKYRKVRWGKNGTIVWRCALPNCSHYTHQEFIEGRLSRCWKCNAVITINREKMQRTRPRCNICTQDAIDLIERMHK